MPLSIKNQTRKRNPRAAFEAMKNKVLGDKYELSLVFCGNTLSRRLNRTYRKKDKPTNVLSFTLSKNSGEIFINLSRTQPFSVLYLFIHGLLHLKGMEHGARMERVEEKLLNGATNNLRDRHRHLTD